MARQKWIIVRAKTFLEKAGKFYSALTTLGAHTQLTKLHKAKTKFYTLVEALAVEVPNNSGAPSPSIKSHLKEILKGVFAKIKKKRKSWRNVIVFATFFDDTFNEQRLAAPLALRFLSLHPFSSDLIDSIRSLRARIQLTTEQEQSLPSADSNRQQWKAVAEYVLLCWVKRSIRKLSGKVCCIVSSIVLLIFRRVLRTEIYLSWLLHFKKLFVASFTASYAPLVVLIFDTFPSLNISGIPWHFIYQCHYDVSTAVQSMKH